MTQEVVFSLSRVSLSRFYFVRQGRRSFARYWSHLEGVFEVGGLDTHLTRPYPDSIASGHPLYATVLSAYRRHLKGLAAQRLYSRLARVTPAVTGRSYGVGHFSVAFYKSRALHRRKLNETVKGLLETNARQTQVRLLRQAMDSLEAMSITDLDRFPDCVTDELTCADCGHLDFCDDVYSVHDGDTVCSQCIDDYEEPQDMPGYYLRDDLTYVDGDGWYVDPPPESDGEDPDNVMDAGVNVMDHLVMDSTFNSTPLGSFHIGVELETEARSSNCVDELVGIVRSHRSPSHGGHSVRAVVKADGSLGSYGCEIVTSPSSYDKQVAWFKDLELPEGTTSWNNGRCGMHVHIHNQAFTALTLAKFLSFWNNPDNASVIRQVAGRHPLFDDKARNYAALPEQNLYDKTKNAAVKALKCSSRGVNSTRYLLVNLCNLASQTKSHLGLNDQAKVAKARARYNDQESTVELRIFRGTLNKQRLLAQIEFAAASVYFCRESSSAALSTDDFVRWLKPKQPRFKHLTKFLGLVPAKTIKPGHSATEAAAEV